MDTITTSVVLSMDQRQKLVALTEWMRLDSMGAVIRALIESEFSRQALVRSDIRGIYPTVVGGD